MTKKYLRLLSFAVQGIYNILCILDVILCLIYKYNFDTTLGSKCAYWALDLTGILFLLPVLPIGIIINILAIPTKQTETTNRNCWIIWTIISPCLYLLFYFSAVCVFVATTGGI